MADPDQPTAASILSSLLLTPTAFVQTPTLASLRATLDSASPHLSTHTNDDALRLALKQVVRHRRKVVDEVEERIGRYKLVGKEGRRKGAAGKVDGMDDDGDGLDDEPGTLDLAAALARLAAEQERLSASISDTDAQLAKAKKDLERAARRIESLDLPDVGDTLPSVRRRVDERVGGLEEGVKALQRQVDGINARAEGSGR